VIFLFQFSRMKKYIDFSSDKQTFHSWAKAGFLVMCAFYIFFCVFD
jgi:hypothetical protein